MAKFSKIADMCLDTNIIISLAGIDNGNQSAINQLKQQDIYSSYIYILEKIKNGEIRAIITPTVYKEIMQGVSRFGTNTINFIRNNNFYLIEVPEQKIEIFNYRVNKLAKIYCGKLTNKQKQEIKKINSKPNFWYADSVFGWKTEKRPINDAIIMAETAILGVPIITNNTKDFTKRGRQDIISYINSSMHLRPSAKPYMPTETESLLKRQKVFQTVNMEWENLIKETVIEQ
ncbi:MAG: hypothetical protein PHQ62_01205 [Clostridia bacterium]|nr:hypothetical protein [Clostridia bacterium]